MEVKTRFCDVCGEEITEPYSVSIGYDDWHYDAHQLCVRELIELNANLSIKNKNQESI